MKVYISGKISGLDPAEAKKNFIKAELRLKHQGHTVMSPKGIMDFAGFEHDDYMHVCKAMVDVCDAIYMLSNWQTSKGSREELNYAKEWRKEVLWEDESTKEE
jgi:hypothetical protein